MLTTHTFNNGQTIPALGFGTWQLKDADCVQAVDVALQTGYRHIDTADVYGNHEAVAAGIKQNGIAREDFFLTTKIFPRDDSFLPENIPPTIDRFLTELETEYLDLVLLHWPDRSVPIGDTLGALHEAVAAGKIRSVGVSNFTEHHLADAMATGHQIICNQVEIHPGFPQRELRTFCAENNLAVTAYSPLGRGEALNMQLIQDLAKKYDKTAGQICLNWLLMTGCIAIPKSSSPERIKENFSAQDFELDTGDVEAIDNNTDGKRIINPDFGDFDY